MTKISIIVAVTRNNAIGTNGDLLYHISADLKHFKEITMGHPIIMGRKTFESFPNGPLPGRRNIVITRNTDYVHQGIEVVHSLKEAIDAVADTDEAMVIGEEKFIVKQCRLRVDCISPRLTRQETTPTHFFPTSIAMSGR